MSELCADKPYSSLVISEFAKGPVAANSRIVNYWTTDAGNFRRLQIGG